ncbi:MAG: hypothetical protein WBI20_08810 [Burkholderiaceae bacterium]
MLIPETLNSAPTAALRATTQRLRSSAAGAHPDFSQALRQLQPAASATLKIAHGDTLIGIVRNQAQAQGLKLSNPQELRLAQQLASANQISNPDLIHTGQHIDVSSLQREWPSLQSSAVPAALSLVQRSALMAANLPRASLTAPLLGSANPVLEKTLERAVAKGFIPPAEKVPVYTKILQMAKSHGFAPDDFARMTLMESDGMNPRASNQRCHGIIQFCDGPARGAASAGYSANPRAILDLSVHQQLNLVDKYFADVGLKNQGPAGLEDLYLSVLNPASRSEARSTTPLNIQGKQARLLHTDSNTDAPITRASIRQGLLQNATDRLASWLPAVLRPSLQTAQHHGENPTPR